MIFPFAIIPEDRRNEYSSMNSLSRPWLCRFAALAMCFFALLSSFTSANAEPSRAYLKCQQTLERYAERHVERADRLRNKYANRFATRIAEARDSGHDSEFVEQAIEQVEKWLIVDEVRAIHVETLIEEIWDLVKPDNPNFECLDRNRTLKVYENNLDAYKRLLEQVYKDVIQRVGLETLKRDEGLVIISYFANVKTDRVLINRRDAVTNNIAFSPFIKGQYFRILKAKAGTYVWDTAWDDTVLGRTRYPLKRSDFTFTVKPGVINYSGTLTIDVSRAGYYSAFFNDRLTIALMMLEQRYPELVGRYDIANGLNPDDRFTDFYLQEKASFLEVAVSSDE